MGATASGSARARYSIDLFAGDLAELVTALDLAAITVPTLVLYGEHEPAFVRRHGPKLEREIRDATLQRVPDAGHASNLDNPEWFTDAVQEFLADALAGGEAVNPE